MKQSLALLTAFLLFQTQIWAFSPNYPNNSQSVSGTYSGTMIGDVTFAAGGGSGTTTTSTVSNTSNNTTTTTTAGTIVVVNPDGTTTTKVINDVNTMTNNSGTTTVNNNNTVSSNGVGVWVIGQPQTGLGTGVFAFFGSGSAYIGTAIAIASPLNSGGGANVEIGTMTGVFDGQATVTTTFNVVDPLTGLSTPATQTTIEGLCAITFTATISSVQAHSPGSQSGTLISGTGDAVFTNPNATQLVGGVVTPITPPPTIGTSNIIVNGYEQSTQVTSTVNISSLTGTTGSASGGSGGGS
jgi:hypothetical protein